MKDVLEKMMQKKDTKKEGLSEMEIQAKMDVLKELLGLAESEMGSRVKNGLDEMKKVTVAAPDDKSLEKGLEKAQELLSMKHEEEETPEKEMKEESEVSEDENELPEEKMLSSKPEEDDEEDSIFNKKNAKSKMQKLMMD